MSGCCCTGACRRPPYTCGGEIGLPPVMDDSTWRSIESAPKDGTVVDLWCRRNWRPPSPFERCCDWFFDRIYDTWRSHKSLHFVDSLEGRNLTATHWMPRPAPPAVAAASPPVSDPLELAEGDAVTWVAKLAPEEMQERIRQLARLGAAMPRLVNR